jgi:hypothetical protein
VKLFRQLPQKNPGRARWWERETFGATIGIGGLNYADVIGQVFRVVGSLTEIAKQGHILPR